MILLAQAIVGTQASTTIMAGTSKLSALQAASHCGHLPLSPAQPMICQRPDAMSCLPCTRRQPHDSQFWPTRGTPAQALASVYPSGARPAATVSTMPLAGGTTTSTAAGLPSNEASLSSRSAGEHYATSACALSASGTSPPQRSSSPTTKGATEKGSVAPAATPRSPPVL